MSSSNGGLIRLVVRLIAVCALGGLTAACFQPMYAEHTIGGGPGLKEAMAQVDIDKVRVSNPQVDNRLGVELYNALSFFFFFNDTAPTEIYTLSLHDALPICRRASTCATRASARSARWWRSR